MKYHCTQGGHYVPSVVVETMVAALAHTTLRARAADVG
jgi:hypothetical protein